MDKQFHQLAIALSSTFLTVLFLVLGLASTKTTQVSESSNQLQISVILEE